MALLGAMLGVLWVLASWLGADAPHLNWLGRPAVVAGLLVVLGAVLQPWASAGGAAGAAAAFLAAAILLTSGADTREEGWGRYPPAGAWAAGVVVAAVACALAGHWLAATLRARRKVSPAP